MKLKFRAFPSLFLLSIVLASAVAAQKSDNSPDAFTPPTNFSGTEHYVLNSLRMLHSAEMTYRNAVGNGNYSSLQLLQQADLIDPVLATGVRYGYRFTVVVRFATATTQPGYDITATPVQRRPRALSFYMNEACDIHAADRLGRDANIADPVVEPCGTSIRTENEAFAMDSMRTLNSAEATYASTYGAGQYGTTAQLYNTDLYVSGFGLSYIWRGYTSQMTVTPTTATMPARFTFSIVPNVYGRTGLRSFYIDETGVLRGADKNGAPADQNDPPVSY